MQLFQGLDRMIDVDISKIDGLIYSVRGRRVMLDSDLAALYGVEVRQLKRQVRRNRARFPDDFMFVLTAEEREILRCQFGTLRWGRHAKYLPFAFTEHGVAMLSSVLSGERAVRVNIEIVRAFVRLRQVLAANKGLAERIEKVEERLAAQDAALGEHAGAIREVFEEVRRLMAPEEEPRRKIGF